MTTRRDSQTLRGGLGRSETVLVQPDETPRPPSRPGRVTPPRDVDTLNTTDDHDEAGYLSARPPAVTDDTAEHAALSPDTTEIPTVRPVVCEPVPPGLVDPTEASVDTAHRRRMGRVASIVIALIPVAAVVLLAPFGIMNAVVGFVSVCAALLFVGPVVWEVLTEGMVIITGKRFWVEAAAAVAIVFGLAFFAATPFEMVAAVAFTVVLLRNIAETALRVRAARFRPSVIEVEVRDEEPAPPQAV
jgi:hypothetical protein